MLAAIHSTPLNLEALSAEVAARVAASAEGCGGIATFAGLVRSTNKGRQVRYLEYEAFAPLALKAFARIQDEAAGEWPDSVLAIHHRTGRLEIGETSVLIVAGAPHRADAFHACRYGIERVKQIAPVWKREFFEGGDDWIEGAPADPDDEAARLAAKRRAACA